MKPLDEFKEALRADEAIEVTHPGPLTIQEMLELRDWFDKRRKARDG